MSYRNPQIIVDRSAEIYAQATSNLGSQMVSAFENLVEKRRVQAEAIRKRNEGFQLIENDIRLKEYENLNKISEKIKGTSIEDQFKEMYTDILEGSENNVGAIKAKSILSTTGSTLTKDQRKQLLDVIDKANNFKTLMLEAAGSIIPDIQEYKENVGSGNIGSKYIWKGGSNAERYSNMLAMNALSDSQISGVTYTKKLERLSDGTIEIVVTNTIDTNSDMFKELIKKGTINKEDLKIDENGVATVVWRRDVKKYGDGVITKIPENIDKVKSLQTAGLIDKNGNPSDILLNERNKISVRRSSGTKQIVEEEHFDKTAILNNKTLNDEYKAFASSIITRPIDEQIGYIENTLGIDGFSYKSWQNLEPEKKINLIKNTLIENSIEQVTGNSFKSRSATKEDVIQYANQGKIINEGDVIYTRTVKGNLSYDKPEGQEDLSEAQKKRIANINDGIVVANNIKRDPRLKFDYNSILDLASDYGLEVYKSSSSDEEADKGIYHEIIIKGSGGTKISILKNDSPDDIAKKIIRAKSPGLGESDLKKVFKEIGKLKQGEGALKPETNSPVIGFIGSTAPTYDYEKQISEAATEFA